MSKVDSSAWALDPRLDHIRRQLAALMVFTVLAIVHTWPLARNPAHLSRNDTGDTLLNTWAIAWVAHQLPRDPAHLFDANIFYPSRLTLGYSEAMVVQGVLAMPILAAGGSPVLAYNLVLMAGLALTGWAFCLLVWRWTGSWAAGYVSGSLAAFNAHVLVRLPHLQTQHPEFIALILFAVDRLLTARRLRDAVWLGIGFALEGLTSVYLLVFSTWMLAFAVLARAADARRRAPGQLLGLLGVAAVTSVMILGPYLLAYAHLHQLTGFERTIDDGQRYAGSWVDYLATGSRLHFTLWSQPFFDRATSAAFPGVMALLLVAVALGRREVRSDGRVRMCLAAAVGCVVVSMVPRAPFYPVLFRWIPLFRVVRVAAHLSQVVLLMIAVVAGFGVDSLRRRWRPTRAWPALAVVLCALVNLEALRAPFDYTPFAEIPAIYHTLATERGAVVVELPFPEPRVFFLNGAYMLNSTRHWRPLLNGYSGFRPGSYDETYSAIQGFPDVAALAALHDRGVTHIVVHMAEFCGTPVGRCAALENASLRLLAEDGDIRIFRLR
jgi:hypothetical protein